MSWWFAVLVPGLLMLVTFGLERLEAGLGSNNTTDEPGDLVAQSPVQVDRVGHQPAPPPLSRDTRTTDLQGRIAFAGLAALDDEPGLPTRVCRREPANPQFQPSRHANRV